MTILSCDHCGWWHLLISHHFKFSRHVLVEVQIKWLLFVTWTYVTTRTKEHVTLKFVPLYHMPPSCLAYLHRSSGNRNNFFICHETWCANAVNSLSDLVDNIFLSEATPLSSLVAIAHMKVKVQLSSFVTWSPDHVIKRSRDFVGGGPLPPRYDYSKACGSRDIIQVGRRVEI